MMLTWGQAILNIEFFCVLKIKFGSHLRLCTRAFGLFCFLIAGIANSAFVAVPQGSKYEACNAQVQQQTSTSLCEPGANATDGTGGSLNARVRLYYIFRWNPMN